MGLIKAVINLGISIGVVNYMYKNRRKIKNYKFIGESLYNTLENYKTYLIIIIMFLLMIIY